MIVFLKYLSWHYTEATKTILKAWGNFLNFNLEYFSIFFLFKTLFSPWRRYSWSYGRGFDIGRWIETFISNFISRILGFFVRSILIVIGFLAEFFILFAGIFVLFVWIFLPLIIVGMIWLSIKILI